MTTIDRALTVALVLVSISCYTSVAQSSESDEDSPVSLVNYRPCSRGSRAKICVPKELCVNGRINTVGQNLIEERFLASEEFDDCDRRGVECCEHTTSNVPSIVVTSTTEDIPDYTDWSGQCGQRAVPESTQGNETDRWEFPWTVGLYSIEMIDGNERDLFLCSGALIDDQAVLAPAGCVHHWNRSNLFVHIGRWNIEAVKEPFMQVIQVERVEIHSGFSASSHVANIAVLVLKESARIGRASNRVCLPEIDNFDTESNCFVVGWAENSDADGTNRLRKLEASPDERKHCWSSIRQRTLTASYRLPPEHLCADYRIADVTPCGMAQGASMVCASRKNGEQFFLAGIASHSVGNCKLNRVVDVFQSPAHHIRWIDSMMTKHNRYPSYYRPDADVDTAESESLTG